MPAPVLVEVDYLVRQRLGHRVLSLFLEDIARGAYQVEDLLSEDYRRVSEICEAYAEMDVGFVDAAVLAVVERLGERKVVTLDRWHFGALQPRHVKSLELLPG